MKKANQNGEYNPQIPAIRKLGTAYDSREFHYTYQNSDIGRLPLKNRVSTEETEKPKTSLINASKLGFNLINHSHEWPKQIGLKVIIGFS